MPLDPETAQAAVQVAQAITPGTLGGLLANGLPSAGVVGTIAVVAYKRIQKAEKTLEAVAMSCLQLIELQDKAKESNGEVVKILDSLIARDKNQHASNLWTQDALKLIVRRLGQTTRRGDTDADALELDLPPSLEV